MKNLEELMLQGRLRRESRRDEFVRKSLLSDEFLDLVQKNKKPFDLMMSYYQNMTKILLNPSKAV